MSKHLLFFLVFLIPTFLFSQEVTINAFVLDADTKTPIPYVNIGFVNKAIGTVTNEEGKFQLVFDEQNVTLLDELQISALGYKTLTVNTRQLYRYLTNRNEIYLKAQPEFLDEVVLTNTNRKDVQLGNTKANKTELGYWKDKSALGGEIATRIKVSHKKTKLKAFSFNILDNQADSLKIRVNVYNLKKRYPEDKILKENIFHTIKQKEGTVSINLKPYNIKVDDDFVIGIELVEVYGETIEFAISAQKYIGTSFLRYVSQDKWKRNPNIGINFGVMSSVPIDDDEVLTTVRPTPKKMTLYWDSSLAMKERYLKKELDFLENYLNEIKDVDIRLVTFSNHIRSSQDFQINKGRSKALINYLETIDYEGASNYNVILKNNDFDADTILLFTDGYSLFNTIEPEVNIPIFTISSNANANHALLQKTAYYADGHYINLAKNSEKVALEFIRNEIQDTIDYTQDQPTNNFLSGRVFSIANPIQGANIRVKNTFTEAQSDVDGLFKIKAEEGDILVVNYLGMIEKEYEINNPNNIAILIKPEGELLDEVIVKVDENENKEVDTGYGKRKEDAIGYDPNIITADDIKPQYNNLADLIVGRFPGVQIIGFDRYNPKFRIRDGGGTLVVLASVEVDGSVYGPDQDFPPIDIQNIHSIVILKSMAATNKYGTLGRGGVIVIKTKTFMGTSEVQTFESALVTGNDYEDSNVKLLSSSEIEIPEYIKSLNSATSFQEAKELYKTLKNRTPLNSIPFYFDISDYFMRWDKAYAYSILTNIASIASENVKALRALAFKMEALNKFEDAASMYEQIALLRPKEEQPYRDLARLYVINKSYKKAMNLYKDMLSNSIEGVEFIGLRKVIENELQHLLAFHRTKVNYSDLPNTYRTATFKYDLRIVFEWNDSNTEFELQFVNPQKKYFTWSHTKFQSKDRLLDEIKYGYSTEDFIIDDAEPGEWIINIECLSKEPLINPTYLKYTVYKNYGKSNETSEVKVIKLYKQNTKVTLDTFLYQ